MQSLITIFFFSFAVALTGAVSPGPLLTYTIVKTLNKQKRGYLTGLWIIIGHAIIELVIIIIVLLGFSLVLQNPIVKIIIGLGGCGFLVFLGILIMIDVFVKKAEIPKPDKKNEEAVTTKKGNTSIIKNPVLGGILVSMSNPYWWIWWASIGAVFMINYSISLNNIPGLAAFFLGHELGDLAWYLLVSILVFFGRFVMTKMVYHIVLVICAIFLIGFGLYLGISIFFY